VIHCLNGLSEQYESAADLISLMPGISFEKYRSLLMLQDMKRKNRRSRNGNGDTALYSNAATAPNSGRGNGGKGKKKKKKATTEDAKDTAIIQAGPVVTPLAAAPLTWPTPLLPWNGAIQMWPYGPGMQARPPSYMHRPSPPSTPSTRKGPIPCRRTMATATAAMLLRLLHMGSALHLRHHRFHRLLRGTSPC
jgi:hypothetical protein